MSIVEQFGPSLLSWAILAAVSALPVLLLWRYLPQPGTLLPRQHTRLVPWGAWDVGMLSFLCLIFLPGLLSEILTKTGVFGHLYGTGPDSPANASPTGLATARFGLWAAVTAFPFQLATIIAVLCLLGQARPYHFGLSRRNAMRHALLGWVWWFCLTPPVLIVNGLAVWGYWLTTGVMPEEHPFARLAQDNPLLFEELLIVVAALVIAPVFEELFFRGILQPWLAQQAWGGAFAMGGAVVLALFLSFPSLMQHEQGIVVILQPVFFALTMMIVGYLAIYVFLRHRFVRPDTASAIYGTALLFAVFHTAVWPTPIPLFLLGLGLGYLAFRTQGTIAPIIMHSLFNAVAVMSLVLAQAWPVTHGKDVTSAEQPPPCSSTSSMVPGSWLPRRAYPKPMAVPKRGDITEEVTFPTSLPSRTSLAPGVTGRE